MRTITSEDYRRAFAQEWLVQVGADRDDILASSSRAESWSDFMLPEGRFLNQVMDRLNKLGPTLTYAREMYAIDVVYAGGHLPELHHSYPARLHVLIEHENGPNVEEEMWKLVHWRAPLKVLIFYDWDECEKTTEKRRDWLEAKLGNLAQISRAVDGFWPENKETEYLFIFGNRGTDQGDIVWRWASSKSLEPMPL